MCISILMNLIEVFPNLIYLFLEVTFILYTLFLSFFLSKTTKKYFSLDIIFLLNGYKKLFVEILTFYIHPTLPHPAPPESPLSRRLYISGQCTTIPHLSLLPLLLILQPKRHSPIIPSVNLHRVGQVTDIEITNIDKEGYDGMSLCVDITQYVLNRMVNMKIHKDLLILNVILFSVMHCIVQFLCDSILITTIYLYRSFYLLFINLNELCLFPNWYFL